MSGTVIDSLIVKLGLDGSNFRKGADDAVRANKAIRDSAETTATTLESKGKIAASFWTEQKVGILGVLGVLAAGGKALEDITVKAATAAAATGRAAQIGNTTPERLSGLRAVAKEYGSTADEATSAINSILKAERDFRASGLVGAPITALKQLGIRSFDKNGQPIDPVVQIEQIAAALKKLPEQQALSFGERFGFSDTFTNALRAVPANSPAAIEKLIQSQASTTDAQVKAGENLVTSEGQLAVAITKFDNDVMVTLAPLLTALIGDLTDAINYLDRNPKVAAAAGIGGAVITGVTGAAMLKKVASWVLGRGGAGAAGEAAELGAGAEVAAAGGSFALTPVLAAAVAAYAAASILAPTTLDPDDEKKLNQLYPNRPRGTPFSVNNPGNLIDPAATQAAGHDVFQNFPTLQAGEDAAKAQLLRDNTVYGLKTVRQIISSWAPSSDGNDTNSYVMQVAAALHKGPDDPVDLTNPQTLNALAVAIFQREGNWYWRHRGSANATLSPSPTSLSGLPASVTSVLNGMRTQQTTAHHNTTIHAPITISGAKNPAATGSAVKASLNTLGMQSARGLS